MELIRLLLLLSRELLFVIDLDICCLLSPDFPKILFLVHLFSKLTVWFCYDVKVQFLDRHHLLIKFGSVDGVVSTM